MAAGEDWAGRDASGPSGLAGVMRHKCQSPKLQHSIGDGNPTTSVLYLARCAAQGKKTSELGGVIGRCDLHNCLS